MFSWITDIIQYFWPPTFEELEFGNVYIFNKTKNNNKDVELIRQTFESLNCKVIEIENRSFKHLKANVKTITEADFSVVKYIVIIILDNTNEDEDIWITKDGKKFHTNGHLLTELHKNVTLKGKLRLSIIQTNRTHKSPIPILRKLNETPSIRYPGNDVIFRATSTGRNLKHKWRADVPSPFIRILCEEILKNKISHEPLSRMLNRITDRVADETDEIPSTEKNFSDPDKDKSEVYLGSATV